MHQEQGFGRMERRHRTPWLPTRPGELGRYLCPVRLAHQALCATPGGRARRNSSLLERSHAPRQSALPAEQHGGSSRVSPSEVYSTSGLPGLFKP